MPEAPNQAAPAPEPQPEVPFPARPETDPGEKTAPEAVPDAAPAPTTKGESPAVEGADPAAGGIAPPAPKAAPARQKRTGRTKSTPSGQAPGGSTAQRRKRRRPSPVPVSMWLLPRFRLPFSTPGEFVRWFFTGVNLWAVAAVLLCAFGGYRLVASLSQPRLPGAEQALAGGEATAGLSYRVERTGEREVTVTGLWDPEAGEDPPGPELAAALCAALSPEEIYGHSDHLYRSVAGRFFQGEDFDLTILLREKEPKKPEEGWEPPEPLFSVTRPAGAEDWPQPDCDAAFARAWRDRYDQYWLFGQGRKEELGPPQSDPVIEEGDLPSEPPPDSSEEEAPPLPDLDGAEDGPGEDPPGEPDSSEPPDDPESPEEPDASSDGGSSSSREEPPEESEPPRGLERFFRWVLEKAKEYRAKGFEEESAKSS